MRRLVSGVMLSICLLAAPALEAHQTGKSTLRCEGADSGELRCALSLSGDDLAHYLQIDADGDGKHQRSDLAGEAQRSAALGHLRGQLRVANGGRVCAASGEDRLEQGAGPGQIDAALGWRCEAPWRALELTNAIMVNTPGGYRHLGYLKVGERELTTVFDASQIEARLEVGEGAAGTAGHTITRYVWEGVVHILGGADHVLFVLVLALGAASLRLLLGMVTAFTLSHSLTLAVSALGMLSPPAALIEPLIALSILVSAALAGRRAYMSERAGAQGVAWALGAPFVFGLLHGFGFSYVLRDEVGLPTGALIPALGAFNVGVELGQLAILAVAAPALWALRRRSEAAHRWAVLIASGLLAAIALYWTVERVM
jgi:hypothetical protein